MQRVVVSKDFFKFFYRFPFRFFILLRIFWIFSTVTCITNRFRTLEATVNGQRQTNEDASVAKGSVLRFAACETLLQFTRALILNYTSTFVEETV